MRACSIDIAAIAFFIVEWLAASRSSTRPMAVHRARRDRHLAAAVRIERVAGDGELAGPRTP
jgi:hypothetical protein